MKLKSSVSFLSIEFEHVDCHSSACLTQNKRFKKNAKLARRYYSFYVLQFDIPTYLFYVLKFDIRTSFYILKFDIRTSLNVLEVRILNLST